MQHARSKFTARSIGIPIHSTGTPNDHQVPQPGLAGIQDDSNTGRARNLLVAWDKHIRLQRPKPASHAQKTAAGGSTESSPPVHWRGQRKKEGTRAGGTTETRPCLAGTTKNIPAFPTPGNAPGAPLLARFLREKACPERSRRVGRNLLSARSHGAAGEQQIPRYARNDKVGENDDLWARMERVSIAERWLPYERQTIFDSACSDALAGHFRAEYRVRHLH